MSGRIAVTVVALVAGLAAGLVLTTTSRGAKPPARSVYLARARAICHEYNARLDRIPPIQDPTLLGVVVESTNRALPILQEQADRIHSLTPPIALRPQIDRFFVLTQKSLDTLRSVRDDARHLDSNNVGVDLIRYGKQSTAAKRIAHRIGYNC
jgi:hypothetical protein